MATNRKDWKSARPLKIFFDFENPQSRFGTLDQPADHHVLITEVYRFPVDLPLRNERSFIPRVDENRLDPLMNEASDESLPGSPRKMRLPARHAQFSRRYAHCPLWYLILFRPQQIATLLLEALTWHVHILLDRRHLMPRDRKFDVTAFETTFCRSVIDTCLGHQFGQSARVGTHPILQHEREARNCGNRRSDIEPDDQTASTNLDDLDGGVAAKGRLQFRQSHDLGGYREREFCRNRFVGFEAKLDSLKIQQEQQHFLPLLCGRSTLLPQPADLGQPSA